MTKPTITKAEFDEALKNNLGFCSACRRFTLDGVEPDAMHYSCPECDRNTVFGTEEALTLGVFTIVEGEACSCHQRRSVEEPDIGWAWWLLLIAVVSLLFLVLGGFIPHPKLN